MLRRVQGLVSDLGGGYAYDLPLSALGFCFLLGVVAVLLAADWSFIAGERKPVDCSGSCGWDFHRCYGIRGSVFQGESDQLTLYVVSSSGAQISVLYVVYSRSPGPLLVLVPCAIGLALGPVSERLRSGPMRKLDIYTMAIVLFAAGAMVLSVPAALMLTSRAEEDLSGSGILDWSLVQDDKQIRRAGWLCRIGHTLLFVLFGFGALIQLKAARLRNTPILGKSN
jgi:hypothetical protein